jgi:hypothetical protein
LNWIDEKLKQVVEFTHEIEIKIKKKDKRKYYFSKVIEKVGLKDKNDKNKEVEGTNLVKL